MKVITIYNRFLARKGYSDYVKTWQLEGFTKSIRMVLRVYLINNKFLVLEGYSNNINFY